MTTALTSPKEKKTVYNLQKIPALAGTNTRLLD